MDENKFYSAEVCLILRDIGCIQGKTEYLWHKDKYQNNKWILYKRNKYDMSSDGDIKGLSRWVAAYQK